MESIIKSKNQSRSLLQTKQLAADFLALIGQAPQLHTATIVGLSGQLGAGKTTLTQALAQNLGIKERVLSPTFIIMRRYQIRETSTPFRWLYHFDCYRLNQPADLLVLGWPEIIQDQANLVLVEWPEKIGSLLPPEYWQINLAVVGPRVRNVTVAWVKGQLDK